MRLRLASREEAGDSKATYAVRLFWRTWQPLTCRAQGLTFGSRGNLLAETAACSRSTILPVEGSSSNGGNVTVGEFLDLDISTASGPDAKIPRPTLCGIEVVLQPSMGR